MVNEVGFVGNENISARKSEDMSCIVTVSKCMLWLVYVENCGYMAKYGAISLFCIIQLNAR